MAQSHLSALRRRNLVRRDEKSAEASDRQNSARPSESSAKVLSRFRVLPRAIHFCGMRSVVTLGGDASETSRVIPQITLELIMAEKKHGPLYPSKVLYPAKLPSPARRKRIEKAVAEVVAKTKPRSLCWCGKFCALHRKLIGLRRRGIDS